MNSRSREELREESSDIRFDVAIIGAGINGASLYHELCGRGYRVLLLDKGDFACGTSQASAMMVWGGLLYLRNFDIKAVVEFSLSRDRMIERLDGRVRKQSFRYIPDSKGRNRWMTLSAFYLYWILSSLRREQPSLQRSFPESNLIKRAEHNLGGILFEEGMLNSSDCRFVLDWITKHSCEWQVALNHTSVEDGAFSKQDKCWRLDLRDQLTGEESHARAACVVNCAGVWADRVNGQFGIESPYKHAFSKGVFAGIKKATGHEVPLIFELGELDDTYLCLPWGPVSLLGPTETAVATPEEGFAPASEDVEYLLHHANRRLSTPVESSDITMLRTGIRPLVVERDYEADVYPLDLSRRFQLVADEAKPWFSTYGGKITGCARFARKVADALARRVGDAKRNGNHANGALGQVEMESFPGMPEPVPSIDWCVRNEACCTLDDYLRRRTNISQWTSREGLGEDNEHLPEIKRLAKRLYPGQATKANRAVRDYVNRVEQTFDRLTGRQLQRNGTAKN